MKEHQYSFQYLRELRRELGIEKQTAPGFSIPENPRDSERVGSPRRKAPYSLGSYESDAWLEAVPLGIARLI